MSTFKSLRKKVLGSRAVRGAACWLAAKYILLVWKTGKWDIRGEEHCQKLYDANQTGILGFWHNRLFMMPMCWRRPRPVHMLISAHRDGELMAKAIKYLGVESIVGSSAKNGQTKGGAVAFRAMLRALKSNEWVGITPDGPRGPRMHAKDGIITLARMSGSPIMPLALSVQRAKHLNSWDRFLFPAPFSKGVLIWGQPFYVDRDLSDDALEGKRRELEVILNELTAEADKAVGRKPISPAEIDPVRPS